MATRCRQCGKPTLGPQYDLCMQCGSGQSRGGARPPQTAPANRPARGTFSPGLSADYLSGGYFDEGGHLRREVVVDQARAFAAELSRANMTSAALRRFYSKLRALDARYRSEKDFEKTKEDLYAFEPLAAYSVGRKVVPGVFLDFIRTNIALAVKDEKHFQAFVTHFQSVVAFFKERDNQRRGG